MSPVCVEEYAALARARLPTEVWDFLDGGSGAETTLRANLAAFRQLALRPRVLCDVGKCDLSGSILGTPMAVPVGIAPLAYHRLFHRDGEIATVAGAREIPALLVVSVFATQPLEEIAAATDSPLWLQMYWFRERSIMVDLIRRAEAAGFDALVLTVDTPVIGRRLRDIRNGFALPPDVGAVNIDPAVMTAAHISCPGTSAIDGHARAAFDPTVTWADLEWLRGVTRLPVLLKGILTAEDAQRAVAHGADGIVVSNHGGRQLDGALASLDALRPVTEAVGVSCPVLVDGGIRTGSDVFKALALGARAVLVGRPVLWGLTVAGGDGVRHILSMLCDELVNCMALAGRTSLRDVDESALALSSHAIGVSGTGEICQ